MSIEIGEGPAYRSYTSFTQWLDCGKKWQLTRLLGVVEEPAVWLAGGKAVHSATEVYDHKLYAEQGR